MICYSFIRQDMGLHHQIVQASHSAYEAGSRYKEFEESTYLICLGIKNLDKLHKAEQILIDNDIKYHKFYEPDNKLGYTSITTEPLSFEQKRLFKKYRLWTAKEYPLKDVA
jgi:hypothetical protein